MDKLDLYLLIEKELKKKDYSVFGSREIDPKTRNSTAGQAKKLGLTYLGFGRYGVKNKDKFETTHRVESGKLVPLTHFRQETKEKNATGKVTKKVGVEYPSAGGSDWKKQHGANWEKHITNAKKTVDAKWNEDDPLVDMKAKFKETEKKLLSLNKGLHKKIMGNEAYKKTLTAFIGDSGFMNKVLYKSPDGTGNETADRKTKWYIRTMDSLFNEDEAAAPMDYPVYTGTSAVLEKGSNFIFKGFMSTSLDPQAAADFMGTSKKGKREPVHIQIDVKKGQKILDISKFGLENEKEHVLPRNTMLKIVDGPVATQSGQLWRAEIVDEDDEDK